MPIWGSVEEAVQSLAPEALLKLQPLRVPDSKLSLKILAAETQPIKIKINITELALKNTLFFSILRIINKYL